MCLIIYIVIKQKENKMPLTRWTNVQTKNTNKEPKVSILPNGLFLFNKASKDTFKIPETCKYVQLYYDEDTQQVVFEFVSTTTDEVPVKLHFSKTGMHFSAKGFIKLFKTKIEETTQFVVKKYKTNSLMIYLDKKQHEMQKTVRRPVLNFIEMGIPVGATLVYTKNKNITAKVVSHNRVEFNGGIYALSSLTKDLKDLSYYLAPCGFWTYQGKKLSNIYDETYLQK